MEINDTIESFIHDDIFQSLISDEEFYFDKILQLFDSYREYDIASFRNSMESFIENPPKSFNFQKMLDDSKATNFHDYLLLIGKLISVFDDKGYNKNVWNPYPDNRVISKANFTQKDWTYCLFKYRLNGYNFNNLEEKRYNSFRHTIKYIENVQTDISCSSHNHREQIIRCFQLEDESELITLFPEFTSNVVNNKNKGVLISRILYHPIVKKHWMDSVVALMASDSTGWQDEFILDLNGHDAGIIWNSKRPTGTNETIKFLREHLKDEKEFSLFYSIGKAVRYRAIVTDFAEDQYDLNSKNWDEKYNVLGFIKKFEKYEDGNLTAKIVFLVKTLEKIEPIPVKDFTFYKNYKAPTQDNLSPILNEYPSIIPVHESMKSPEIDEKMTSKIKKISKVSLNQILYGPPGTGKTFNTVNKALQIIKPDFNFNQRRDVIKSEFDKLVNSGRIVFTTFHQSMSYEDFVEGIKPLPPKEDGQPVRYKVQDGIFKKICNKANPSFGNIEVVMEEFKKEISEEDGKQPITIKAKGTSFDVIYRGTHLFYVQPHASAKEKPWYAVNIDNIYKAFETGSFDGVYKQTYVREIITYLENNKGLQKGEKQEKDNEPFVIIIDEINRGNVSQIFGELITLIEEDKRLGGDEALEVYLPYSKEKFGVPSNLFIIGTMNTADRSVEALDTALRRRFTFEEMSPKPLIIKEFGEAKEGIVSVNSYEVDLVNLLEIINKRIEVLLDRDHLIGHSYFLCINDWKGLREAFSKQVIPLLQEYFYGDYGKISLVIGEGFCSGKKEQNVSDVFAAATDYEIDAFSDKVVYTIHDPIKMDEQKLEKAMRTLLKNEVKDKTEVE